ILEVNIVNYFCDRPNGRIIDSCPLNQNFQSAAVTLMCELCLEHIEAQLIGQWLISFWRNKLEAGARIDEATDEPCARHPVDVDAFASNPGLALQILAASCPNIADLLARSLIMHARFSPGDEPHRRLAARRAEKINGDNFGKAPFQASHVDLNLGAATTLDLFIGHGNLGKATSFISNLPIFSLSS